MLQLLMICMILLVPVKIAFTEESSKIQDSKKRQEKYEQDFRKMQSEDLEILKKIDPDLYRKKKDALDRAEKIMDIVSSFRQNKISDSKAKQQLYPLVKAEMQEQIDNLDTAIERLEKKLAYFKKAKSDPELLIENKIDQFLGKSLPTFEEALY